MSGAGLGCGCDLWVGTHKLGLVSHKELLGPTWSKVAAGGFQDTTQAGHAFAQRVGPWVWEREVDGAEDEAPRAWQLCRTQWSLLTGSARAVLRLGTSGHFLSPALHALSHKGWLSALATAPGPPGTPAAPALS